MKRRHFLSLAGGSAAGLALAHLPSLGRKLFAPGARRVRFGPGVESFVPTTCTLCPAGCGVLARVVDGHLVKLEGNPLHPINRGRLCALGQAGVHLVHNPNRIRRPQKRVGPRGTGSYAPVSWDEATQLLASKLLEAHGAGHGHSVVALDGSPGLAGRVLNRLLTALGSPNHLVDRPVDSMESAAWLTQGERMRPGYDLERARFLLSLGAPLMESWWSPVLAQRIYAQRTTESGRNRMRLVHFDTRFSSTAAVADEWYPVKPGGFQALALSFAYVVVKETLYDHEFLSRYTAGFFSEPSPL
ncbi:MAG: molybdopterin-dependent oxidoreductase, partial [Candidatus Wallbacteria bacterium]|nr:molybdopterin-dependent oxidoreductase [Candidatus Wallbacteria bacterium]